MAAKILLLAAEALNAGAGTATGAVKIDDIVNYRTYMNIQGQKVHVIETSTGMLPAIIVTPVANSNVDALPAPVQTASSIANEHNVPAVAPLGTQYPGSSFA